MWNVGLNVKKGLLASLSEYKKYLYLKLIRTQFQELYGQNNENE